MSTFNGIISEFPDIKIDYFRKNANTPPPLACFLSHVHSDHLAGLESLRSPFVYCSAATREILLRLERYPCRINYAKGILEARQQTYKHLAKVLKPLPLETPTIIELCPNRHIQVTLFDANHCPGAVMFLIEADEKAVLYTGDIRSEPWFVNSIARSPILVEYTSGIKTLDKIYLDTSFTRNVPFQTKAEGIAELLKMVSQYPSDTVFYIQTWTYGYEDVWVALSKALKSPVHVDDYKLRIYSSLKARSSEARFSSDYHLTPESPALTGYMCGNAPHPGCLTADESVRIHSCEKGNMCEMARRPSTVIIQPIIAHLPTGEDIVEVGVGGGGDDLQQKAELDYLDEPSLNAVLKTLSSSDELSAEARKMLVGVLAQSASTGRNFRLDQGASSLDNGSSINDIVIRIAEKLVKNPMIQAHSENEPETLPKLIQFPYSRHSSYPELCQLVNIFRPRDVWPCTVDMTEWLGAGVSIASLFGEFCSGEKFEHDAKMQELSEGQESLNISSRDNSPRTTESKRLLESHSDTSKTPLLIESQPGTPNPSSSSQGMVRLTSPLPETQVAGGAGTQVDADATKAIEGAALTPTPRRKRTFDVFSNEDPKDGEKAQSVVDPGSSFCSVISDQHSTARREAYFQMIDNLESEDWEPISLISTSNEHTVKEQEL